MRKRLPTGDSPLSTVDPPLLAVRSPAWISGAAEAIARPSALTKVVRGPVVRSAVRTARSMAWTVTSSPTMPATGSWVEVKTGWVKVGTYSSVQRKSTYGPVTCGNPVPTGILNHSALT
jgi:hypothetical protein